MTPHLRVGGVCAMSLIGALSGCRREVSRHTFPVASVRLTCRPIVRGVQCQLLALSTDVSQAPRDVTSEASWHLSGVAGAHLSSMGIVEAGREGDVGIDVDYQSRTAHRMVRLSRTGPGQLLTILRGRAFAEHSGSLQPVAGVRLEVASGPDAGRSATTERDGGYELAGLVPGTLELRATKPGYEPNELTVSIEPGDAHVSVLMRAPIRRDGGPHEVVGIGHVMAASPEPSGPFTSRSRVARRRARDREDTSANVPSVRDASCIAGPPAFRSRDDPPFG
jgi:hypothetical protein